MPHRIRQDSRTPDLAPLPLAPAAQAAGGPAGDAADRTRYRACGDYWFAEDAADRRDHRPTAGGSLPALSR